MSGERRRLSDMLWAGFGLGVGLMATVENVFAERARTPQRFPWWTIGVILLQVVAWIFVIRRLRKAQP
jgi:hypothetical protein